MVIIGFGLSSLVSTGTLFNFNRIKRYAFMKAYEREQTSTDGKEGKVKNNEKES